MVFGGSDPEGEHISLQMKNLLTSQALASMSFYWVEFGDELTAKWLAEHTKKHGGLEQVGWGKYLARLMTTEPEETVVRRITQKPRGGSGNNPYLSDNRHAMEYTVLIEPLAIAKKVMTVREQIAVEWAEDLSRIDAENFELLRHHQDTVTMEENKAESARQLVYDHDDDFGDTSTPYRARNYRRLLEEVTATGVKRYSAELRTRGDRYTLNWLEKFMHRCGEEKKGNALLEAMLAGTMVMIKDPRRERPRVIVPAEVGQGVMKHRAQAAKEASALAAEAAEEHATLRRGLLEYQLKNEMDAQVLNEHRRRITEAVASDDDSKGG